MDKAREILKKGLNADSGPPSSPRIIEMVTSAHETLAQVCDRLQEHLATGHARYRGPDAGRLQDELRDSTSPITTKLSEGFHKLVPIETSRGLNEQGVFDYDKLFISYLRKILFNAFELEPLEYFHPEQISQILKDEDMALFVFLDAHHIPECDIQRLRGFTQGVHRVLLCEPSARPESENPATDDNRVIEDSSPVLRWIGGDRSGEEVELKRNRVIIGRSPEYCHIVLDPNGVARRHAEIFRKAGDYYLADLNSRNGTKVNGNKVIPGIDHRLADGDAINICGVELLFAFKEPDWDARETTLDDHVALRWD